MAEAVPSRGVYLAVFAALMLLLVVTVAVAYVPLGRANVFVALFIAFVKAMLVIAYFMHARYTGPMIRLIAGGSFVWLAILLGLTLSDYESRAWLSGGETGEQTAPVSRPE